MKCNMSLDEAYRLHFGRADNPHLIFSPYRICPLGAHVDHQHGVVTGFAFDKGIELLFSPTDSGKIEMCSLSFEGLVAFNVRNTIDAVQHNWGDYVRGATFALKQKYDLRRGFRGVIKGSMPIGGLSSSAAALVSYVMALAYANGLELSPMEVVEFASYAEREYVGLRNGILDQACVVLCRKDALLSLDTSDNDYRILPVNPAMKDFEIAVFFSGVTRSLIGTDYNLRVSECKTAAWCMQAYKDIPLHDFEQTRLRDVPRALFDEVGERMPARFRRRAEHFYAECDRVQRGVEAWLRGDIEGFGRLVFESCRSSIDNYECGSEELKALYEIMLATEGIYGGRFSGAGFKGCCIALIDPAYRESIERRVSEEYLSRYPQYRELFEVHFCRTEAGARFVY